MCIIVLHHIVTHGVKLLPHSVQSMGFFHFVSFGSGINPRGCAPGLRARREAPDGLQLYLNPVGEEKICASVVGFRAEIGSTAMVTGEKGLQWIGFEGPSL